MQRSGMLAVAGARQGWARSSSAVLASQPRTSLARALASQRAPLQLMVARSFGAKRKENTLIKVWTPPFEPARADLDKVKTFTAERRHASGKYIAQALRREGKIPGIVQVVKHTNNQKNIAESFMVALRHEEVLKQLKTDYLMTNLYQLKIEGEEKSMIVVPSLCHAMPQSTQINNLTFTEYTPGRRVKLDLPVKLNNVEDCVGIKQGGIVLTVDSKIPVWFKGGYELPRCIVVDMDNAVAGSVVRMKDEFLPPGCTIRYGDPRKPKRQFVLLTMHGKNREQMLKEKEAADAEKAAAAAVKKKPEPKKVEPVEKEKKNKDDD